MMEIAREVGVNYEQTFVLDDGEKIEITGPGLIYFTKVEYRMVQLPEGNTTSILLLNIPGKELSYQVFNRKRRMPAITGLQTKRIGEYEWIDNISLPAVKMKNGKTGFKSEVLVDDEYEQEVIRSYAMNITDEQMEELLPYCDASEFEPYRNKKLSMDDEGVDVYLDWAILNFKAITDSYIPLMELPIECFHNKKHMWPHEKLYMYLKKMIVEDSKCLIGKWPKGDWVSRLL